jgi:hypothetical protein
MEIIAKHFTDPSVSIRGFALEFYLILAELFLEFDFLDPNITQQFLQNPETFESESNPLSPLTF